MDIHYNLTLVFISLILAIFASYASLSIASRIPYVDKKIAWLWISGGSISMGLAIWSMHFVGMLAFHINTPIAFDLTLTGISILYAIVATNVAFIIIRKGYRNFYNLLIATFFMGSGIAAMHYTGMDALKMQPFIIYDQTLFILSLVIAYIASFVALRLFFIGADDPISAHEIFSKQRFYSSCIMGIAIAGMHYTGMEAAIFAEGSICGAIDTGIESGILTILIIMGVILVIFLMMLLLLLDSKFTDNKRLIESERRVTSVINSAPQGMLVTNLNGTILQANDTIQQITGYNVNPLKGKSIETLIPHLISQHYVAFKDDYSKHQKHPQTIYSKSFCAKHINGHEVSIEVGLSPIQSEDEILILATIIDITEHIKLEKELERKRNDLIKANQRILLATDSAEIGIWDYNLINNTVLWDKWMHILYDIPEGQFDGSYEMWEKTLHPDDLSNVKEKIQSAIQNGGFDAKFRIIKQDGSMAWIKAIGTVVKNEDDQAISMIGINQDISDKVANQDVIWRQANFDSLTGLPNRKWFHELLQQEFKECHRQNRQLWALFLDLDGFKEVNDTMGHHTGDQLLILVAERIRSCMRESDIVARLGGDEFAIISNADHANDVDIIASKLNAALAKSFLLNNQHVYISVSIGIANYPNDADNADDLLKFADQSMYSAKQGGKNRFSYFTPELQEASLKRVKILSDMHQAIKNSEFELYYQPIINLKNHSIYKAEALIRWNHPDKGLINPGSFISIAEETGYINEIGSWVFERAFQQLKEWQIKHDSDFQLSINMSPFQLKVTNDKYFDWLDLLKKYDVSGQQIVVEITESLLLKSDQVVTDRLLQYRDANVEVAIDDFGTGYSSLSYLKEFDIDYLKIDQSFTRNLKNNSREHSLSQAIVVMAHQLGLKVIAEGVETKEQEKLLFEMGCDYAQGFLYAKPMSAEHFTSYQKK